MFTLFADIATLDPDHAYRVISGLVLIGCLIAAFIGSLVYVAILTVSEYCNARNRRNRRNRLAIASRRNRR